jgi:hypothetical protein
MAADKKTNSSDRPMLTNCQLQMKDVIDHLRKTLETAAGHKDEILKEQRESLDADICLASRSAYFDFYTWVVLHGEIDEPAARELDELFQVALALMQPGDFKNSVQARYDEFTAKCNGIRTGVNSPNASSI